MSGEGLEQILILFDSVCLVGTTTDRGDMGGGDYNRLLILREDTEITQCNKKKKKKKLTPLHNADNDSRKG